MELSDLRAQFFHVCYLYVDQMLSIPFIYYLSIISLILFFMMVVLPFLFFSTRYLRTILHPKNYSHKHVVITGVSSMGLGRALVQDIFLRGAYVTIIGGRNHEKLRELVNSLDSNNNK